jgi:hypothetical protein
MPYISRYHGGFGVPYIGWLATCKRAVTPERILYFARFHQSSLIEAWKCIREDYRLERRGISVRSSFF